MSEASGVAMSGPLSGSAEAFKGYLAGLGYAPLSIVLRLRLLAHLSRWLQGEGLLAGDCDSDAVERFVLVRRATHKDLAGHGALGPLLTFLRAAGLIPELTPPGPAQDPVEVVLEQWGVYLARERGLRPGTVRCYRSLGRPLIASRLRGAEVDLVGLSAGDVSAFVSERVPGLSIGTAKLTITALRSLLRFLHASGQVTARLDGVVPARAGYRDAGLPRWLVADQVASVIAACDPSTVVGRRDRAMVLILARLGLRAAEVARISLDDLDWRAGTIRITGKGGYIDQVPLPVDVGAALAAHLSDVRPASASDRRLFLRSLAPYRGLSPNGVASAVFHAGKRAGLDRLGAHLLRHSVATATINAGASLEETAQLLRHRSLDSTTIYAKVDLTRLATITRPWPSASDSGITGVPGGRR